jgi:hypothetical protein
MNAHGKRTLGMGPGSAAVGSKLGGVMILAAIILVAGSIPALAVPTKVIGGSGEQYDPFVSGTLVGYSTWASKRSHAYVRDLGAASTVRVDPVGWQGEMGGFDPVTGKVLYTQWDGSHAGNLYYFDAVTHTRSKIGALETPKWEWDGRISSSYILFLRDQKIDGVWYANVVLYRRSNGATRILERYRWSKTKDVEAGTVGDRYATWTVCPRDWSCRAMVYDASKRVVRKIPTKRDRRQYAPAVDETNNVVYFTRLGGSRWCHSVNVWRLPLGKLRSAPTKIFGLPDGVDTGWTSSLTVDGTTGEVDYYFERYLCSGTGDIYRVANVDQVT